MINNGSSLPIINIPATLTPILGQAPPAVASVTANPIFDTATLIGIGTAIYAGIKTHLSAKTADTRTSALASNDEKTVNSLKSSDLGAASDAIGVNALVMKLCENPDLSKILNQPTDANHGLQGKSVVEFLKDQSDGWEKSNKEYYSNAGPTDGDMSKDPVLRKIANVSKMTTPTIS
jgi:hypothetical protein